MPTPQEILEVLDRSADEWVWLAVTWHVAIAGAIISAAAGWRPSERLAGALLPLPLLSVSLVSAFEGNPFNAVVPFGLCAALVASALRLKGDRVEARPMWSASAGAVLVLFGLTYPHSLDAASPFEYLYAAPTGIVPCPTLSLVIGAVVILRGLRSVLYSSILGAGGLFYGLFGAFRLGVPIDLFLAAGAALVIALAVVDSLQAKRAPASE